MKVSYYPGCSLEVTARPYQISTQAVCRALGVELAEVPDWLCCGSSPALKMDGLLSTALAAANLALAAQQHLGAVVAPCPFCYRRLLTAQHELQQDPELERRVADLVTAKLQDGLRVYHLLEFIREAVGLPAVQTRITKPLTGLKVVPYYGCYLVKPGQLVGFDDPEDPTSLDQLLTALGVQVLPWDFKTECCGASLTVSRPEVARQLTGRLLREAAYRGADAIVVVCQLCQANLDLQQRRLEKEHRTRYNLPVLYFTQLLGLAFGLEPTALGLQYHLIEPRGRLEARGLAR